MTQANIMNARNAAAKYSFSNLLDGPTSKANNHSTNRMAHRINISPPYHPFPLASPCNAGRGKD